ncbi:PorP/SprF family type IX secretion system membrane protein [Larkinella soli]|uniref:PorP/SprF family type IX secretion system membrane protein n=1 Tax=Larkinella soli TaxID=1770527 RepID=UPI000FFCA2AD|nr:PorP/SprF family type IX secretion system membrane protein [Larkinella soli]
MIRSFVRTFAIASILLIAGGQQVSAQREVLYSQYMINPLTINPAYAGSRDVLSMTAVFRRKWFSVPGAPVTQTFGADGALPGGKVGLGLLALNDRMGLYSATGISGAIAYRFNVTALSKLSIGASGGINVLPIYDPSTSAGINKVLPSFGLGIYYQADRFWAGISKPELVSRPLALAVSQAAPLTYQRPLFVNLGGRFDAGESIVFLPSILLTQQNDLPLGIDLNAKAWLEQKLGLGISYRANNSTLISTQNYVVLMAEYQLANTIRVGYSFSSQTIEYPYFPQKSVHEIIFRFTPSPINFLYQ